MYSPEHYSLDSSANESNGKKSFVPNRTERTTWDCSKAEKQPVLSETLKRCDVAHRGVCVWAVCQFTGRSCHVVSKQGAVISGLMKTMQVD